MPRCAANKIESLPGNELLTVSDKRLTQCSPTVVTGHTAYVISATDYSAFGAPLAGRKWNADGYRFGFGGQEKDDEVKGSGNSYDFGARIHDVRLGRMLSVDPLFKQFADESSYIFGGNCPVFLVDENGEKKITYITILNQDNTTTKIKIVERNTVITKHEPTNVFGISTHDYSIVEYDIQESIIIDNRNGLGEIAYTTTYKERGLFSFVDDFIETDVGKTKVGGGIFFTSTKGQGYESKIAESNFSIENIDALLAVVSSAKAASGEQANNWAKRLGKIVESYEIVSNLSIQDGDLGIMGSKTSVSLFKCESCANAGRDSIYKDSSGFVTPAKGNPTEKRYTHN